MLVPGTLALTLLLAALAASGPLSTDFYLPSMPEIATQLHASPSEVQFTISLFLFGFAAGQIAYGPFSDRHGRKSVLLLSMGVVATPTPGHGNVLTQAVPIFKKPPRADALLMVECRGSLAPAAPIAPTTRSAVLPARSFQGRY